ncbi:hypothetical protein Tsubulata_037451 [Turnera subulata]|uniref:WRKY domain-containing protein n=1 Tax=Turnera subulata TaxID=218843 RepID=A0A9Q0JRN5_9ROSI|nr:hypothetical protein Tsubulata_037451 [Turnera subulata]
MDSPSSPDLDSKVSEVKAETQSSKRRKVVEKTVVRVKIGENAGKLKSEGPPSDFWSWRKYGQKPIKGSPYPRGYYRCSTSKGCSAKKQVERCRTDSSVLVITYTSSHNHPGPDLLETNLCQQQKEHQTLSPENHPMTPKEEEHQPQEEQEEEKQNQEPTTVLAANDEDTSDVHNFHYLQAPTSPPQDILITQEHPFIEPFMENPEKAHDTFGIVLDGEPVASCPEVMTFSSPKSEENDFFDELEELPTSSAFSSFMRSNFFDERIPVVPS